MLDVVLSVPLSEEDEADVVDGVFDVTVVVVGGVGAGIDGSLTDLITVFSASGGLTGVFDEAAVDVDAAAATPVVNFRISSSVCCLINLYFSVSISVSDSESEIL